MLRNYITSEEEKILLFLVIIGFIGVLSFYFKGMISSHKEKEKMVLQLENDENLKYNINEVSFEELANIPEIGPKLALNIVAYRDSILFQNLTDIAGVKGIGRNKYMKIKHYFYNLNSMSINELREENELLDINKAEMKDLVKVKGISDKKAKKIMKLRENVAGFKSLKELEKISGIGPKTVERLKSYFYAGERNGK